MTRALQVDVSDKLARGVAAEGGSQWWLSPTAADREAAAAAAAAVAGAEQEAEYVRSRTPASQRAAPRAPSAAEKPARRAQAVAIVAEAPNAPPSPGSGGLALEWFESGTAAGPEIWGEQTAVPASAVGRGGASAAEEARRSWSELHPSPDGLEAGTPVLTTSSLGGSGPSSWRRPSTPSTISAARRRSREGSREGLRSWDGGPEAGHDPIDLRPRTPLEAGPDGDGESKKASVNVQIPSAVFAS